MSRLLAECDELHIIADDSAPKISDLGERNHRMSVGIVREVIYQIYNTILQSANIESEDDVRYQRTRIAVDGHRRSRVCASHDEILGPSSRMNASSAARASPAPSFRV